MNNSITILVTLFSALLLNSCGNEVEEIKNPSTGKLLKRFEYFTDDSGQKIKDGEYIEWDNNGKKIAELHYAKDSLDGKCTYFPEDGTIEELTFSNGKLNGIQIYRNAIGTIVRKVNVANGLCEGEQTYFYDNGKLKCKGSCHDGKNVKVWNYYDKTGKQIFQLNFKNDICLELTGTWLLDDGLTTFEFRRNGTFIFKEPLFKHSLHAIEKASGDYSVSNQLHMIDIEGGKMWGFEIVNIEKDKLILINAAGDGSKLIFKRKV